MLCGIMVNLLYYLLLKMSFLIRYIYYILLLLHYILFTYISDYTYYSLFYNLFIFLLILFVLALYKNIFNIDINNHFLLKFDFDWLNLLWLTNLLPFNPGLVKVFAIKLFSLTYLFLTSFVTTLYFYNNLKYYWLMINIIYNNCIWKIL
jgi:hypothetical protein